MTSIIMGAIEWLIVPLILVLIFIYAFFIIPNEINDKLIKNSTIAGRYAGLIVLVMFIVSQKNKRMVFQFYIPEYNFAFWTTFLSVCTGFVFSWFFDYIKGSRVLGIFVLALVAITSITFYSYLFINDVRSTIIFTALGIGFGVLVHRVFFPEDFIGIFKKAEQEDFKDKL